MNKRYDWRKSRGLFDAFKAIYLAGKNGVSLRFLSEELKRQRSVITEQVYSLSAEGLVKSKIKKTEKIVWADIDTLSNKTGQKNNAELKAKILASKNFDDLIGISNGSFNYDGHIKVSPETKILLIKLAEQTASQIVLKNLSKDLEKTKKENTRLKEEIKCLKKQK